MNDISADEKPYVRRGWSHTVEIEHEHEMRVRFKSALSSARLQAHACGAAAIMDDRGLFFVQTDETPNDDLILGNAMLYVSSDGSTPPITELGIAIGQAGNIARQREDDVAVLRTGDTTWKPVEMSLYDVMTPLEKSLTPAICFVTARGELT